ncbi:MAG: Fic family protein [Sedimentisphaerales bacterium]|nr:Fic family protein [Sedimentisphaerales bacterium]
MKRPQCPPDINQIKSELSDNPQRIMKIFDAISSPLVKDKYHHWDKIRYYDPPGNFSSKEWWLGIKYRRQELSRVIPLNDRQGFPFKFAKIDYIEEASYKITQNSAGSIQMPEQITNPQTRDQYYISSLIQEAITSSQIEGAATTRQVAKEMIRSGRKPRDKSEQMIINNYLAMELINGLKDEPLTKELIFKIHQLITYKTIDQSALGRFRTNQEQIVVADMYNEVLHEPPPAEQLDDRVQKMCDFANGKIPKNFIHPLVRSIILHFWLAYEHPFVDGNGRTARALFYWSMLKNGFWLFEFVSISQIIVQAYAKYEKAFLYTETDDNDLTYFILYHLDVIQKSIDELHNYIKRKTQRILQLENELKGMAGLNHRQRALINHALRHPNYRYTIESHRKCHNVVYQTARLDLLDLAKKKLLTSIKIRKVWYFQPDTDLEKKLATPINSD